VDALSTFFVVLILLLSAVTLVVGLRS